jgi:endonuclease/exonuclease/phosphatase family metal-dependent hydrolase
MRIMCLNAWGGKLDQDLLAYLEAETPDILCLQEVVHSPDTDHDWLTYRDGDHVLPQQANFFRDVCGVLPEHTATFCPAARGVLWDGDAAVPSQWGLATFVHRALPVIGQVQGFVHKAYSPDRYGDHPRSRSAHGIRVWDHEAERPVCVTQMHGLRDLRGKMDTPERAAQAQRLLDLADAVAEPGDLSVICGDFNVEPGGETHRLFKAAGLTELVETSGADGTRTSHYRKPGRFADYMWINQLEAVRMFEVVRDPEVSDHCPLVLDI